MKKCLKILFLLATVYLLVPYTIGLYGKISQPHFKNISLLDYFWIGLILMVMILLNFKWLFWDKLKRKK
jgi:hypothetical protein